MRKKRSIQRQLTLLVGVILLICNLILMALLNYAISLALKDLVIFVDDMQIEVRNIDDFSFNVKMYGYICAFLTTGVGTLLTYVLLGRYLSPLKKLSKHMDHMDRQNLSESVELTSRTQEVSSLITSFNHMTKKLQQSFEMQKDFSSYVAHELKTPLAVLQAKAEIYRKKEHAEGDIEKLSDEVSAQVGKLNNIVSKILELSHIERMELAEDIPLDILLEDLLVDFEEIAAAEHIKLEFRASAPSGYCAEHRTFSVRGNYTLLYQAFFNLVENAIKYSDSAGYIKVMAESEKTGVYIKVCDTGSGIPKEDKEHIFEPFFRGGNHEILKKDGIGIGLAFSKKVFDHHMAQMRVKDNTPRGTIVEVHFKR